MVTHLAFFSYLKGSHRKAVLFILLCLATLNVTACDYINRVFYPDFKHSEEKIAVEKPPFLKDRASDDISITEIKDIAKNTQANDNTITVNPAVIGNAPSVDIASVIGEKNIFSTPLKNDQERFERLENKVQNISDMINKMSPAITRLVDVESELNMLTFQLEEIINKGQLRQAAARPSTNTPAPMMMEPILTPTMKTAPAPASVPAMEKPITVTPMAERKSSVTYANIQPAPQIQAQDSVNDFGAGDIHKIRLGDHTSKTRVVFELDEKKPYTITMADNSKTMIVNFPTAQYGSNANSRARLSDRVKSITQSKTSKGSSLIFSLAKPATKTKDFRMNPDKDVSRQRVVIDLIY